MSVAIFSAMTGLRHFLELLEEALCSFALH